MPSDPQAHFDDQPSPPPELGSQPYSTMLPAAPTEPAANLPGTTSIFAGRLHPLTIVFGLLRAARGIIPVIPLVIFGNKMYGLFLLVMIAASTVAVSLARYFS